MLSVVAYYRVSTEEQSKGGYSLPEQRLACQKRAAALADDAHDTLALHEFEDHAGGDVLDRPVLEQLRQFVREHIPDVFICLDPDRFSRKLVNQLLVAEEIERVGTRLEFVQHEYRRDADGQAFFAIRGVFAQLEKAKILERTRRGRQGKIRAGKVPSYAKPYGYQFVTGSDNPVVVDPEEAAWVQRIFAWSADDGLTCRAIARRLTNLRAPTPRRRSHVWSPSSIGKLLRNTAYKGQLRVNAHDTAGVSAMRQLPAEWRKERGVKLTGKIRPTSEWHFIAIPGIVAEDIWEQAQATLQTHTRVRGFDSSRWLRGLGRCGVCGSKIYYGALGKGDLQYLSCSSRFGKSGVERSRCNMPNKLVSRVESEVWQQLKQWILQPAEILAVLEQRTKDGSEHKARLASQLASLQERAAGVEVEIQRVGLLYARGYWTLEDTDKELSRLKIEQKELLTKIADTRTQLKRLDTVDAAAKLVHRAENIRNILQHKIDTLNPEQRHRIATELLDHFVLHYSPRKKPPIVECIPRLQIVQERLLR